MKRVLLFVVALCIAISATPQDKTPVLNLKKKASPVRIIDEPESYTVTPGLYPLKRSSKNLTATAFASCGNIYGLLYTDGPVYSNAKFNLVSFVHRGGGVFGNSGNNIRCKWTKDLGVSWDSVAWPAQNGQAHRYPVHSWNIGQNTTSLANAYMLATGPSHLSGTWNYNYFNIAKGSDAGNENITNQTLIPMPADTFMPIYGGNCIYNNIAHVSGDASDLANSEWQYHRVYKGTWNNTTNNFDWTYTNITNLWKYRIFSNGTAKSCFNTSTWWEKDGLHGYFFAIGQDSLDDPNLAQQLHLWVTNDGGNTWTKLPAYDFSNDDTITSYIWPTAASLYANPNNPELWEFRPSFPAGSTIDENRIPAVVDAWGRLHLVCQVEGMYSKHPDSLNYIFANHPAMFFDIIYDRANNKYSAFPICAVASKVADPQNSGFGTGNDAVGWDHEFNVIISSDGKKVFYIWTDTDTTMNEYNISPDIFGMGWDMENNCWTDIINFTVGTDLEATNYFVNTGREALDGTGPNNKYIIPVTHIPSLTTPLNPVVIYYIDGIYFKDADFVHCGAQNVKKVEKPKFSVSQNYPNPAKDMTSVEVQLVSSSNLSLTITNLMGQVVAEYNKGFVSAGKHVFNINTEKLQAGIYFYTVKAGNNIVTNKMIVE